METVNLMWVALLAYVLIQFYMLLQWKGRWFFVSLLPLLLMSPIIGIAMYGLSREQSRWPLWLLFAGPAVLLLQVILVVVHASVARPSMGDGSDAD